MTGLVYDVQPILQCFGLIVNEMLKLTLALVAFLSLVAVLELAAGYATYYVLEPENQQRLAAMLSPQSELLVELGVLRLAILGIAFAAAYQLYVKGPLKIAEGIHIILNAHPSHRLKPAGPPEVRRLARAVNELAEHSETLTHDLEAKVAQAKSSVEEEKNRLAALMSELSQGVLVCNRNGRILLYNERARQALGASAGAGSATLIGLGRPIFALIDRSLLRHARERIEARLEKGETDSNAQFVFTTSTGQFIRVHMAPILTPASLPTQAGGPPGQPTGQGTVSGFVMTVENITRGFELDATRDMLLQSFTEGSRASLAGIRAAVEMLTLLSRLRADPARSLHSNHQRGSQQPERQAAQIDRRPRRFAQDPLAAGGNAGRGRDRRGAPSDRNPTRIGGPVGRSRPFDLGQGRQLHVGPGCWTISPAG